MIVKPRDLGPFAVGAVAFTVETDDLGLAERLRSCLIDLDVSQRAVTIHAEAGHADAEVVDAEAAVTTFTVRRNQGATLSGWTLWRDMEVCETWLSDEYVTTHVAWEITRLVEERSTSELLVHASSVSLGDSAVVLAGSSMSGKSTLAAWLTTRGWRYIADETSFIDEAAVVRPFWRPIGLRTGGPIDDLLPDHGDYHLVPASSLGQLGGPARVSAVVIVSRAPHGAMPMNAPRALTSAQGACALASHLPAFSSRGVAEFERLAALVRAVPVLTLEVSDLGSAERALRSLSSSR
jgi:hypothetical protein